LLEATERRYPAVDCLLAYDDDDTQSKIVQAGFDVMLTEPAPVGELLDAVGSADIYRKEESVTPAACKEASVFSVQFVCSFSTSKPSRDEQLV
jgi:hypothetical protein